MSQKKVDFFLSYGRICQECGKPSRHCVRIPEPDREWMICRACLEAIEDCIEELL